MKRTYLLFIIVVLVGLVFYPGCKSEEAANYILTVTVGTGVNGNPVTGSYTYAENDTVSYSYSAMNGYGNLQVTLDGAPVANTGTVAMNANHTLAATADVDVRGNWNGTWSFPGGTFNFQATFSGNILSGEIDGHIAYGGLGPGTERGNYTVTGNTIEFDMNYYYGTLFFEGTINSGTNMSGDWSATGSSGNLGQWELSR